MNRDCIFCGLPSLHKGSVAAHVVDLLESDPDYLFTIRGIADRVVASPETVRVVINRLAHRGLIESRPADRTGLGAGNQEFLYRWIGRTTGWRMIAVRDDATV